MPLTLLQKGWIAAAAMVLAAMLADMLGLVAIDAIYWSLGLVVLLPLGWWIMPSGAALSRAWRRSRR